MGGKKGGETIEVKEELEGGPDQERIGDPPKETEKWSVEGEG